MIQISAKQDGFRRCGIAHPKQATQYPDKHFTAVQRTLLVFNRRFRKTKQGSWTDIKLGPPGLVAAP